MRPQRSPHFPEEALPVPPVLSISPYPAFPSPYGLKAGSKVEYYLKVEDVRGMHETSPEDASETTVHTVLVN